MPLYSVGPTLLSRKVKCMPKETISVGNRKKSQEKTLVYRGKLSHEMAIVCRGRLRPYVWELKARRNRKKLLGKSS